MPKTLVLALILMASAAATRPSRLPQDQITYSIAGDQASAMNLPAKLDYLRALGVTTLAIPADASSRALVEAARDRNLAIISTGNLRARSDPRFAAAAIDVISKAAATNVLAKVYRADTRYPGGAQAALRQWTFLSDPNVGPFALSVRKFMPKAPAEELQRRVMLAHAMLLVLRGAPVIGAGDEKGLAPPGGVDPLYQAIAELAHIRLTHSALTRGLQTIRYSSDRPGLLAVSRFEPGSGREMLLLFNTSTQPLKQEVRVSPRSRKFEVLAGSCPLAAQRRGHVEIELPALGYSVCNAR